MASAQRAHNNALCHRRSHTYTTGVHDDEDPEYSILKQRMVAKMKDEGLAIDDSFSLSDITKVAERTITAVSLWCFLLVWC